MRLFAFLLFLIPGSIFANVIDAGALTWHAGVVEKPIAIHSDNEDIQRLAAKAFQTHGAYKVVPMDEAIFVFRIHWVDKDSVSLSIESGAPLQVQFKKKVDGEDWQSATLAACDIAVSKTLGVPGYFSGKLAFVGKRPGAFTEVFVGDLFFQSVQQITQDGADVVLPRWSPDGKQLLYTSYYLSGFPDIFLVDLDTRERRPFATYQGTNSGGVFSPNGQLVAMVLSSTGNPEVFVSGRDGNEPRRLTRIKSLKASPSWAPNGERIVVTSDELGGPQLYQVSLRSDDWRRIPTNISGYCAEPDWNPKDETKIVFTAAVNKSFQLALYDFNKRKSEFITQDVGDCIEPHWLNDGRHVVYTHRIKDDHKLWILDTISGKKTQISPEDFGDAMLASFHRS